MCVSVRVVIYLNINLLMCTIAVTAATAATMFVVVGFSFNYCNERKKKSTTVRRE